MFTQKRPTRANWLGLAILFPALWISACGNTASASSAETSNHSAMALGAQTTSAETTANAQLWEGETRGYMMQDDAASDDVAFLVHLGHVQAAIGRVNSYDKEDGMSNPFTPAVMEGYAAIDSIISGRDPADLSLQPLLSEMAAPKTFATIMDRDRSRRMEQNAIQTQLRNLILRVDAVVTEIFPSTRASALAMSALFLEAGEMLRTGLATDGKILDIADYRDAVQLMEASLRLRVNKVSACERSSKAIDQLKSRGPVGNLLDRFIIVSATGAVGGNAGDAFDAAEKLEQLGLSLPDDDALICK